MTELVSLVSSFGLPAVVASALIYILLRSEFQFRYPRSGKK